MERDPEDIYRKIAQEAVASAEREVNTSRERAIKEQSNLDLIEQHARRAAHFHTILKERGVDHDSLVPLTRQFMVHEWFGEKYLRNTKVF
jgi:hypothetical protein